MSENTMLYAIYRMGYRTHATVHGFRATMSTLLNEKEYNADVIERLLSHQEKIMLETHTTGRNIYLSGENFFSG